MARALDFSAIDDPTRQAILDFVNRAPQPRYLTSARHGGWMMDDPATGFSGNQPGYAIGWTVAQRILEKRDAMPGGEFTEITQFGDIAGFAQDKLDDLVFTLSDHALHRNRVEFLFDGPACRIAILSLIESAENYIHVMSFVYFGDFVGQAINNALKAKAGAGVEVRVMLEVRSSESNLQELPPLKNRAGRHDISAMIEDLTDAGVHVVPAGPISDRISNADLQNKVAEGLSQVWVDEQIELNNRLMIDRNHYDHRKLLVADGRRAIVMSVGIGDEYLYPAGVPTLGNGAGLAPRWHDAATVIQGGAAVEVHREFAKRWCLSGGTLFDISSEQFAPPPTPVGSDTVYFLSCRPGLCFGDNIFDLSVPPEEDRNRLRNLYAKSLIEIAQREVLVENPYPIDHHLLLAWAEALQVKPGVALTLVRPSRRANDFPFLNLAVVGEYLDWIFRRMDRRLLDAGAQLAEFTTAFNHLKVAVVDGWLATHGSYNLNYRSARKDLEFNVVVESKTYASQVRNMILQDIGAATAITEAPTFSMPEAAIIAGIVLLGGESFIETIG